MRAICLRSRSGPEGFTVEERPRPEPRSGEVLVRVHAAGVTPTELSWVPTWTTNEGTPRSFPVVPGHEFSGEIAALGAGVTGVAVGDLVYGMNDWYADGAQAEFCVAPLEWIAPKPLTLDHTAAAITPISALTAWQGLIERCDVKSEQRVLIHGGSGAVGAFAVQLAKWRGAHVIATASSHNLDSVRSLGAAEVVDYRTSKFEDVVREVDAVFDTVGGETLARSWGVLKPGGRLVTIAASGEVTADERTKTAFFIVEANRAQLAEVARLIDGGVLRPEVGGAFPFTEARAAYEHKPRRGKAVLRVV
ncbi:NADP-dependent oxidoreductase [Limnoglobus roseus]|uniref:NADP-dependent oxidoreductase n=1 Tax=Limnoglobus roseus TaxID=2598579 RepID=A0A5C1AA69_9BACT|nr:NADP-dependent oxidoreductase [Limnoglobus roseus]QEL15073.1 NADP-dependent oxidoreductase [Limnoglobus roseus]